MHNIHNNINNEIIAEEKQLFQENESKKNKANIAEIDEHIHVVVIGQTRVGKSSLISLLTNDHDKQIEIGKAGGADSTLKKVSSYGVRHDTKTIFHFCDTPGTSDTDNKESDVRILNQTQRALYKSGANYMKIIWMVKPQDAKIPELQTEAKFINKLGNEMNVNRVLLKKRKNSMWNSVLMIVKKPNNTQSLTANSKGAIAASVDFIKDDVESFLERE